MWRRDFLLTMAAAPGLRGPLDVLKPALALDEANMAALRRYVFQTEEVYEKYDREARALRRVSTHTAEVNLLGGRMYWRFTSRDGQPLSAAEEQAEQRRLREHLSQKRDGFGSTNSSFEEWREERNYLRELPDALQWRIAGEETVQGRLCTVLEGEPKRTYRPRHRLAASLLTNRRMRLWIDQEEAHWVRSRVESLDKLRYELQQMVLGRFSLPYSTGVLNRVNAPAGTVETAELRRLEDGTWVPHRIVMEKPDLFRSTVQYRNFRKFETEIKLEYETAAPPAP